MRNRKSRKSNLGALKAALWIGLLSVLRLSSAEAQEETPERVTGFGGVAWEASKSEVVERWGTPSRVESLPDGGENLWYNHEELRAGSQVFFMVYPSRGLVKGGYDIPLPDSEGCKATYEQTASVVGEPYSELPQLNFCRLRGSRMPMNSWQDSRGGLIGVYLSGGEAHLEFEAPFYERFATDR